MHNMVQREKFMVTTMDDGGILSSFAMGSPSCARYGGEPPSGAVP